MNAITFVERGSAALECRTLNPESPGSNPPLLPFRSLGIFVLSTMPQFTQLCTWLYRQWWKCERMLFAHNCSVAMLPTI